LKYKNFFGLQELLFPAVSKASKPIEAQVIEPQPATQTATFA
jgi:hypothetical protein